MRRIYSGDSGKEEKFFLKVVYTGNFSGCSQQTTLGHI
jgi:hypothetical protein